MMLFGRSFRIGGTWAAIVGAACALNAFVGLGETILMVERPKLNLLNSVIAIAAAVALNLILIPTFGPLGAALGMLVPYTLQGVLRAVEISWVFDWRWPWRAVVKPWAAALAALPPAVAIRWFMAGPLAELAAACVYVAGYLAAWKLVGIEPSDREVLAHLFLRRPAADDAAI
jgi:O-antigen/teichoic acid export membrane protein